jgi:hypothetical protein
MPFGVRRGLPRVVLLVSPCTLHQDRAGAFHGHRDGRTGHIHHAFGQEHLRWVGHFGHAVLAHFKHTHLRGGPKAVLHRAQQAVRLVAVAFQVEHRIDNMLQHARAGDNALFGDVPDHKHGNPRHLGQVAQAAGTLAHL